MKELSTMILDQGSLSESTGPRQLWRRYLPGIGGMAAVAVGCIAWATINFGSPHHAWLYARGVRVTIEPSAVTVPEGKEGDARDAVFLVLNLADKPVGILGGTVSCACVSTDKFPVIIPPNATKELHVALRLLKSPTGDVEQTIVYHTDHPAAPSLTAKVRGRVID